MNNTDNTARFWAYSNYLIALSRLIDNEYQSQEDLAKAIVNSSGFQKIYRGTSINVDEIAQSLRLSWYTELLLSKTISYSDILPYATPWSLVQTYYAIYPAIRAYFMALGRAVDKSHESSIKTIGSDFISCKGRFPHPWICVLTGDPHQQTFYLQNDPQNTHISMSNPLNSPYTNDPWQHYGLFLRTTRERMFERKVENWKRENERKRLMKTDRVKLLSQLRPTNIFDALYRVRARSNYQDIDSFAFTSIETFDYKKLQMSLCNIVGSTLTVFETIIARALGKQSYRRIVSEFSLTPLGNNVGETYLKRWEIIEKSF